MWRAGGRCASCGSTLSSPVDGTVTSGFGPRWGRNHDGLDIAAVLVLILLAGTVFALIGDPLEFLEPEITPSLPTWAAPPVMLQPLSATSRVMKIGISSNTDRLARLEGDTPCVFVLVLADCGGNSDAQIQCDDLEAERTHCHVRAFQQFIQQSVHAYGLIESAVERLAELRGGGEPVRRQLGQRGQHRRHRAGAEPQHEDRHHGDFRDRIEADQHRIDAGVERAMPAHGDTQR